MRRFPAALALIALAVLATAPPAAAFTLEPVSPNASGSNAPLAEPGELAPIQRLTTDPNGTPAYKFGDSGFSFSITGRSGSAYPGANYLDSSRPPLFAPFVFGRSPLDSYSR